jgi:hypothetical protein
VRKVTCLEVLIDGSTSHVTHELSDEVFKHTRSVGGTGDFTSAEVAAKSG